MKQILLASAALAIGVGSAFAATTDTTAAPNTAAPAASHARDFSNMSGSSTAPPSTMSGDVFATVPAREDLSSKVVGLEIYNSANQDIGKIKDIAFDRNGVSAYIVAVGGVLGMGDHYVAVKPGAVDISYDANAKKWHATMNSDAARLKAAPEYKYSSND
jgi:sporulation protein YlmC with PRC-barrel domain